MTTSAVASATVDPWAPAPSLEPARVLQPTAGNGLSAVAAVQHVSSSQEDANAKQRMSTKTPESFLGENSALVNLDNLMGTTSITTKAGWFRSLNVICSQLNVFEWLR
uniref:Uncharacterized protein n=1 Tax=Ascaris lumbricoides TaxID=6252 RepID=A0A0M3IJ13_ASCLU